jgi:Flp pilus assembly protein TadB
VFGPVLACVTRWFAFSFRLPTLWIPLPDGSNASTAAASSETNALQELCQEIHKTIQRKVQSNMSQLQEQSREAVTRIHALLESEKAKRATVRSLKAYRFALALPLLLSVFMLAAIDVIEVVSTSLLSHVCPLCVLACWCRHDARGRLKWTC